MRNLISIGLLAGVIAIILLVGSVIFTYHLVQDARDVMYSSIPEKKYPEERPPPTGCPYGDSIPLDVCEKFGPMDEPEPKREANLQPVTEGK